MLRHYFTLLLLFFITLVTQAGEITFLQHINGSGIKSGVQLELRDDLYKKYTTQSIKSVSDRIVLRGGILPSALTQTDWGLEVVFNVYSWNKSGSPLPIKKQERLKIGHQVTPRYDEDMSVYRFSGAHRVVLELVSVIKTGSLSTSSILSDNFSLDIEMDIDRYHSISSTAPSIKHSLTSNTIDFAWTGSAENFDLEWYFFSSDQESSVSYPATPSEISRFDYSRVTVSNNRYSLNLPFDNGRVYYRVRGVGRGIKLSDGTIDFTRRIEGPWSNSTDDYVDVTNLEPTKNWTYEASYAEEGKRKEVLTFFDGLSHQRQVVTKGNTTNTALISETFYDYEGRASIQTLPSPNKTYSSNLDFYPQLHTSYVPNTVTNKDEEFLFQHPAPLDL